MTSHYRARLAAAIAASEALTAALRALAADGDAGPDLLDLAQIAERYGVGRSAIVAASRRGELELHAGPRRRILVDAERLAQWLRSRRHVPQQRPANDLEGWEAQAAAMLGGLTGVR